MEKEPMRRGVLFNAEDEKLLESLKEKLKATHGSVSVTSIVRLGLRALAASLKAKK